MQKSNPVNFLIVGTGRSGTTTLFEVLRRHPDIFIPQRKECRYFSDMPGNFSGPSRQYANNVISSLGEYRALFKQAKPGQLCGDISPDYLYYHHNSVPKILNEVGRKIPIIIVLRNPVNRSYSDYLHHVKQGRETLSFESALDAEEDRIFANWPCGWFYTKVGLYAEQVEAYTDNFDRVLLLLYEEDIVTGQAAGKILDFLGLPHHPGRIPIIHANAAGYPANPFLHRMMTRILMDEIIVRKIKNVFEMTPFHAKSKQIQRKLLEANLKKEDMKMEIRMMLTDRFSKDVARLAKQTRLPVYKYWTDFQK